MPTEPARSGPKSLPDRLRQEKGGVPVWLWIAGGTTAAVALYILWKRRQAPKVTGAMEYTPAYRNSTGYDGAGGAAGGGGGGSLLPILDQPPQSETQAPSVASSGGSAFEWASPTWWDLDQSYGGARPSAQDYYSSIQSGYQSGVENPNQSQYWFTYQPGPDYPLSIPGTSPSSTPSPLGQLGYVDEYGTFFQTMDTPQNRDYITQKGYQIVGQA